MHLDGFIFELPGEEHRSSYSVANGAAICKSGITNTHTVIQTDLISAQYSTVLLQYH